MAENSIPAVSRAVDVLNALARSGPATIGELTEALAIPRSTVYRILNTLEGSATVIRDAENAYRLGPHLVRLARSVSIGADLVTLARPYMETLSEEISMTCKLSVLEGREALVVAVVESRRGYSVSTQVGRRFPLHAGAASKLLLASLADAELQGLLSARLERFTSSTITALDALRQEIAAIRRAGIAEDRSEYVDGVHAIAAPVVGEGGRCVAALSVPFFAQTPAATVARVESALRATTRKLSAALGAD